MLVEYFIVAYSFAAPFFSDTDTAHVKAQTPRAALHKYKKAYKHPCGLYAAGCYASAADYHKGKKVLAQWLCNDVLAQKKATEGLSGYSLLHKKPGTFQVNSKWYSVKNPKEGVVVEPPDNVEAK
mgnify:CR=1 FL=1